MELFDSFIAHVHSKNPVVDPYRARMMMRRKQVEGPGWDAESCLSLLICAHGALARPFSSHSLTHAELEKSHAMSYFHSAMMRLGTAMISTGVIGAQCLFLAGVFLMSTMKPFEAWRLFLQALAHCQSWTNISKRDRTPSSTELAEEESVYWSSWKSERELRFELDLSETSSVISLDSPRQFPSVPKQYEGEDLTSWYFYLSEISLWRLETDAKAEMKEYLLNGEFKSFAAFGEMATDYLKRIEAWRENLAPAVSLSEHDPKTDQDICRFVLRGRATYLHELVTWIFVYAAINDNPTSPSMQSPEIRQWVGMGASLHLDRLIINRPGYYHRHHGTWLMLRSSARRYVVCASELIVISC
jgi:hypothetical protein